MKGGMTTIISGIEKIDAITGGFQPGELVLICGRPGMGKSTLLERMALNVAKQAVRDKNAEYLLYFGLEKKWPLRKFPRFRGIRNIQDQAVIVVDDCLTIEDILENIRHQKKIRRVSGVAIDYLQLIGARAQAESRIDGTTAIVRQLKLLAVEEQICVLLASQLWRNVDKRLGHIPELADLAMIGDIEPLTDMAIFLLRPYHVGGMHGTPLEILPGPTTVTVAKTRHGAIGSCELRTWEFVESEGMFSWRLYNNSDYVRRHLRWIFFGSHNPDDGVASEEFKQSNGYVVNGLRMNNDGFARLNAGLRWPLAADDPILDHDISGNIPELDQSSAPDQYNAICPLDGYVLAINAEWHDRLPPGEHIYKNGPDLQYRLCPLCLMELSSRMLTRRTKPWAIGTL